LSVLLLSFVIADAIYLRARYGSVDLYLENYAIYHQTSSSLPERHLDESATGLLPRRYEVVNTGVDSYSPLLEFLMLRQKWTRFEPDVVVLNFDVSDLVQDSY